MYEFKPSPYSSHSLLLASLPAEGQGRRVLDLGCGDGYLAERFAARGYDVTGVERAGGITRPFPASVKLVDADLNDGVPGVGGDFAYILCADILEHLRQPIRLLEQLPRLLEPRGRLIASLPNSGNLYFRVNTIGGRMPQHDRGLFDRTHLHFFTWQQWGELFRKGGFLIESVRPTGIPVGLALPRLDGTLPVRLMERVCYEFGRAWKSLFAYQFVVVAKPDVR